MRRLLLLTALLAAGPAFSAPAKLTVDFGFFPKGTSCKVYGTSGKVRLKTGREIEFTIKGDTGDVSFRCQQPDGRSFTVRTAPLLPQGAPRLVAMQINQDGNAHILWDEGGLRRAVFPDALNWE
jgi:hypothetical protein